MDKNIVYESKRGTWAPHMESNLAMGMRSCKNLLVLLLKFLFFICKMPFAGGGIDNKKVIKK